MQDAFGSSQPPFRIWRHTLSSSSSSSSSSDYFIHLGRRTVRRIPAKEVAFPDQIPDYGSVFSASFLGEAAQKYLPDTRSAREESHAFTPRARPRVEFQISPDDDDDDQMIGGGGRRKQSGSDRSR